MLGQTIFTAITVLIGAVATAICAVLYFQRVRLERPPIGVFNARDICVLFFFILTLPFLYLMLPGMALTGFLVVTFISALYIALRPLLPLRVLWPVILGLLTVNIVITNTLLGTREGWQLYWVLTSIAVLIAAVGVSNLYVQGGMRLQHVAWFALVLAFSDGLFGFVIPILGRLADAFEGRPLDPSIGFTMGVYNANIGLGDLLVYALFMVAAYKGFGKRGAIASLIIIPIFGALMPAAAPLFIAATIRTGIGIVVPAQMFFGPAAFVTYHILAWRTPERSMAEWYNIQAAMGRQPARVVRRVRPAVSQGVGSR